MAERFVEIFEERIENGESRLAYEGFDKRMHDVGEADIKKLNSDVASINASIENVKENIETVLNAIKAASFEGSTVPGLSWVDSVYSITNTLTNVTTSNPVVRVSKGGSFNTTLSPESGYGLAVSQVTVTMGVKDITSSVATAKDGNVVISIPEVTANVTIAAEGVATEEES